MDIRRTERLRKYTTHAFNTTSNSKKKLAVIRGGLEENSH